MKNQIFPLMVGDVISHHQMSSLEGKNLQKGMHFGNSPTHSVLLMSVRPGAPYRDQVLEDGKVLIYEGHDLPMTQGVQNPKDFDQPFRHGSGLTQNGKFFEAAVGYKKGVRQPELVRVYEKVRSGIWVYNGMFRLIDAWKENDGKRDVYKFRLEITDEDIPIECERELDHNRIIPSEIKRVVWKRDGGKCVTCGSTDNLHFDHIVPFSKGGTSLKAENIQLLCARHNLAKRDKIE